MSSTDFLSQLPLPLILAALEKTPELARSVQQTVISHQKEQVELVARQEEERKMALFTRIIQDSSTPLGVFSRCKDEGTDFIQWALYDRSFESFVALLQKVKGFSIVAQAPENTNHEPIVTIELGTKVEEPLFVQVLSLLKNNPQGLVFKEISSAIRAGKERLRNELKTLVESNLVILSKITQKRKTGGVIIYKWTAK